MARKFYRRCWLNPPGVQSFASVIAKLELNKYVNHEDVRRACFEDASLAISDCNRNIDLSFWVDFNDQKDIDNVQHKVNRLRKVVNDFCDTWESAVAEGQRYIEESN